MTKIDALNKEKVDCLTKIADEVVRFIFDKIKNSKHNKDISFVFHLINAIYTSSIANYVEQVLGVDSIADLIHVYSRNNEEIMRILELHTHMKYGDLTIDDVQNAKEKKLRKNVGKVKRKNGNT